MISEDYGMKKDRISSIDLHLLANVVVTKVVFPVHFIQVKQWMDNDVYSNESGCLTKVYGRLGVYFSRVIAVIPTFFGISHLLLRGLWSVIEC